MRRFAAVVLTSLIPAALAAQSAATQPPNDGVMFAFERFADLFGGRLVAAFDSIPAARYDYRPTPVQQSIGYIAQHLEGANYALCERFSDVKHRRTAKDSLADTIKAKWPKDTLVARLRASLQFCDSSLGRAGPLQSEVLATNLLLFETDLAEHYSQLSTYMRLLGMVPPSALPPSKHTAIELPVSALSPYVGVYRVVAGLDLYVTMQDGKLFIRSTGGETVRLWPESSTDFFVNEVDAQLTFTRDTSGAVTGLVWHQLGRDRPATKVPPPTHP
jgi:uncharacterized protein DUF3471